MGTYALMYIGTKKKNKVVLKYKYQQRYIQTKVLFQKLYMSTSAITNVIYVDDYGNTMIYL